MIRGNVTVTAREEAERQLEILKRGVAQIVSEEELLDKLEKSVAEGRPLKIKYGADPSAPDIHLGHTVCLRKMRQFQELGHEVLFIIGDFTGRIGDPTGKSETRRQLSEEEVQANARTYREQVFKILDPARTRVLFNSAWLGKLNFYDVINLSAKYTVARMLERDEFQKRLSEGRPLGIHELLYPLAQAYDSVAIEADLELGGTDQTFNFMVARDIQREFGQEPQVVLTMPILVGTDGVNKMSKSLGNYIGINDEPSDMYGKCMSIPDQLILQYFELVTDVPMAKVRQMEADMKSGKLNPMDAKMWLAREIVTLFHGKEDAELAEREFVRVFRQKDAPHEIPVVTIPAAQLTDGRMPIVALLSLTGLAPSNSEARRLIAQGGVRLDGSKVSDERALVDVRDGMLLKVGKRRFAKLALK
ncbi:MAG TPA: tyrosine--tRNA ligase [Firmicutes bacterium]|nr:tyrosine--tRNA ligase [Bacillota bacterium]